MKQKNSKKQRNLNIRVDMDLYEKLCEIKNKNNIKTTNNMVVILLKYAIDNIKEIKITL